MNEEKEKKTESDYRVLQEELERRYGPALAQEIVDQIKKAEQPETVPDYMVVKALSEATELFRSETRKAVRTLKQGKKPRKGTGEKSRIVDLGEERSLRDLERLFGLYFQCQGLFYRLYRKALAGCREEIPWQRPTRREHQPEKARAA